MKKYKTKRIEIEKKYDHETLCDWCNKDHRHDSEGRYDAFSVDFEIKFGSNYPEGGSGELYSVDLCQSCSKKLMLIMKENGIRIQESEWDF